MGVAVFVYYLPLCAFVQVRQSKNVLFLNAKANSTKKCHCTSDGIRFGQNGRTLTTFRFELRHTPISDVTIVSSLGNSDHNMICCTVHCDHEPLVAQKVIRDYKRGDYDTITDRLAEINWDTFVDTNESWNHFRKLLMNLVELHIPQKVSYATRHS